MSALDSAPGESARVLRLLMVGLLLGVMALGVVAVRPARHLVARDDPPPEKAAQMQTAVDLEGQLAEPDAELMDPFADAGPAADVAAVKVQVPQLIAADRATFRVPLDEAAIGQRLGPPLDATWSTVARQVQYQEKYDTLKDIVQGLLDTRPYSDNRFVVDAWHGVRVTGLEAFALLDGHDEYLDGWGWQADPLRQWQVGLLFEDGHWKLTELYGLDPANTGP